MQTEHNDDTSPTRVGNVFTAGLGAAVQAVEVLTELGAETARAVIDRSRTTARQADRRYQEAARRGDLLIKGVAARLADRADHAADVTAAWVDRQIVRRVAESMKPYLIEQYVPEVIDGVLPTIREDVVPVVVEDLANDKQIQDLVTAQSKDLLSRSVAEARHASADADDRVEALLRRLLLGRRGAEE
jgi:hypothetical protein